MRLLAKSVALDNTNDLQAMTLVGHLEMGILAALEFEAIAPVIVERLDLDITPEALIKSIALGSWIHDWGKGSEDFQAFIQSKSDKNLLREEFGITSPLLPKAQQAIRHELLSLILAYKLNDVWTWLKPVPAAALFGVLGHHLKVENYEYFNRAIATDLKIFANTSDFKQVLTLGVKYFELDPQLPKLPNKISADVLEECNRSIKDWCCRTQERCQKDFQKLKEIAVVKALVMSADLAASALLEKERGDRTYTQWIREAFEQTLTADEIQKVIDERLEGKRLLPFQKREAEKKARVLIVIAGCGAGKTIVPFVRFQRLIQQQELKAKMFFCYPTTATTSQGFKDYGLTLAEKSLLSHSRVWVDYQLKGLSESYESESDDETRDNQDADPVILFQTKVEALKLWHSKLVFCTAHTVLGLIQNHRKGLYGFPGIVQGAFVFDEIHAYPPQLFGALLQFLRVFRHTQVVLMSASLTPAQLQAIQDVLAENQESADILTGPEDIEKLERYQLVAIANQEPAWDEAIAELKNGGKVLWITNRVADSQHLYTEAVDRLKDAGLPVQPILYHARFRYQDSIEQHEKLVHAFRDNQPAFAITTQIAEMSLDISCTLLISANAPMWSLVQRLGRLNRWVKRIEMEDGKERYELETGKHCKALIYPWQQGPYSRKDLETGKKLLDLLGGKVVRQVDLTDAIATLSTDPPKPASSTWLETWLTRQKELMPTTYTIQVVLEDDVGKIFKAAQSSKNKPSLEAQKWAVSVRIKKSTKSWKTNRAFKFYRIAPTEEYHYHPSIGVYDAKDEFLKTRYGHQT